MNILQVCSVHNHAKGDNRCRDPGITYLTITILHVHTESIILLLL